MGRWARGKKGQWMEALFSVESTINPGGALGLEAGGRCASANPPKSTSMDDSCGLGGRFFGLAISIKADWGLALKKEHPVVQQ